MSKQTLVDTFTFTPIETLTEDQNGVKKYICEGRVQFADKPNANKRIYSRSLLESKMINDPKVKEALTERRLLGMLDHPADGKTTLENASHIITNLYMKEDGEVIGRLEVLSTPKGQILKALCEDRVPWGASTRGNGSLKPSADGRYQVVQEDFEFQTIDAVFNPSTFGAFPQLVESEENSNIKENIMTGSERFADLEARASKALGVKTKSLGADARSLVESNLTQFMVEASKLGAESPEVSKLADNLITELAAKRTALRSLTEDAYTMGNADSGVVREMPKEEPPFPGQGGHIVDPVALQVPSEMEQMILALVGGDLTPAVGNAIPVSESEDEDEDDKKKKKKKEGEEGEEEDKVEESVKFAAAVLKNTKNTVAVRGLAAAYLTEAAKRRSELKAYKQIIEKMQEKFDAAVKSGKVIVENTDESLNLKYKLATDVLKEVVRRYHVNEAFHYAKDTLTETGLSQNKMVVEFIAESLRTNGTIKGIQEAFQLLDDAIGQVLTESKTTEVAAPALTEEVKTPPSAVPPADLPLKGLDTKIANLNESTQVNPSITLASRLSKSLNNGRAK